MKTKFIIFFALITFVANAQNSTDKNFKVGVKLGAGASALSDTSSSMILGANLGVELAYRLYEDIWIEGIPQFMLNGGRTDNSNLRISNLQFPLNVRWNIDMNTGDVKTYLSGGGYIGYGLSAVSYLKVPVNKSGYQYVSSPSLYKLGLMDRFDYGLQFGLGIEVQKVKIGFVFSRGLSSLNNQGAKLNSGFLNFTRYL